MRALLLLVGLLFCGHLSAQVPRVITAEFFWGTDPGVGNGTPLIATDGNFDHAFEQAMVSGMPAGSGPQRFSIRAKGNGGAWGPVCSAVVDALSMRSLDLDFAELYWDEDPQNGSPFFVADFTLPGSPAFLNAALFFIPPSFSGLHKLSVQTWGADIAGSTVFSMIVEVLQKRTVHVSNAEYFWDTDPGPGNGTPLPATDGAFNKAFEEAGASIPTTGLSAVPHILNVRARGADLVWGSAMRTVVNIDVPPIAVSLSLRVGLQGCMNGATGNMTDALGTADLIPTTEPYSSLGYNLGSSAGATIDPAMLNTTFPPTGNVVDWVLVELHPANAPQQVAVVMPLIMRRGGTVANTIGDFPFLFSITPGNYYLVVRHRNHLAAAYAVPLSITTNGASYSVDLTAAASAAYGTEGTVLVGNKYCLWSGDAVPDGQIKYTGAANDRDPILAAIGGTVPTNTVVAYSALDVNLDGVIKYTGNGNDRDPILVNIGGTVPTNVRHAQLP